MHGEHAPHVPIARVGQIEWKLADPIQTLLSYQHRRHNDTIGLNETPKKCRIMPNTVLVATIGPPVNASLLFSVQLDGTTKHETDSCVSFHHVNVSPKHGRAS
jgi:hypothetical protein